jgi:hypothetical protein
MSEIALADPTKMAVNAIGEPDVASLKCTVNVAKA